MMRKFKALKRTSIAKSTPSLNTLDFSENASVRQQIQLHSPSSSNFGTNYESDHQMDDDSSVLDGVIDLFVLLPDGKQVRTPVEARTPMMDVLVQVTAGNGISAGGMMLKVPIDRPPGYLHYKPNMPIGKLGCTTVEVVPKAAVCEVPRKHAPRGPNLPFEPTIRIQIDLPRNQKTFLRVSPLLTLGEVFYRICQEANLEPLQAYQLRAAKSISFPLNLGRRLGEVGVVDFAIVSASSNVCKSTSDILGTISRMSQEEKEKRKNKRFFGLLKRKPPAPKPDAGIEIQKTTLNGQSAVEVLGFDKPKRTAGRDRPLSVPPNFVESSDGETSSELGHKRDSLAVKPKKRPAPPPPVSEAAADLPNNSGANKTSTFPSENASRSQHERRGSDSSSGYHGSSQPSPNPPLASDSTGVVGSVHHVSGSEKSTFSYKSIASGDYRQQRPFGSTKEDHSDALAQKKKHKAPLPPPAAVECEVESGNKSPALESPVRVDAENVKTDATTDTRCSSPATAEDVDKNFQEVIQQIQKQISAEDAVAASASATIRSTDSPAPAPTVEQSEKTAVPEVTTASQVDVRPAKAVVVSQLSFSTSKLDFDETVAKTTQKPTDLDDSLATSYAELRLSWNKKEQISKVPDASTNLQLSGTTPASLLFQTDGLLMIKPDEDEDEEDERYSDSDVEPPPSNLDNGVDSVLPIGQGHVQNRLFNKPSALPPSIEPKPEREPKMDKNAEPVAKSTVGGAQGGVEVKRVEKNQNGRQESIASPIKFTSQPLEKERPPSVTSQKSDAMEPLSIQSTISQIQAPVVSPGAARERPWSNRIDVASTNIVYNDPKKDLYPSMTVKSFEEEYYTKSPSNVVSDYVKAVRYGLVAEFSASKDERERSKEKIEATVAKQASAIDDRLRGKSNFGRFGFTTPTSTLESTRSNSYGSSVGADASSSTQQDEAIAVINARLQREYEKLQAMFADWQFRLKQNELIIDGGRKLSLEQSLAFERLQDEMMQQHRFVQELCGQVQKLEKESTASSTTETLRNLPNPEILGRSTIASKIVSNGQGERRITTAAVGARQMVVGKLQSNDVAPVQVKKSVQPVAEESGPKTKPEVKWQANGPAIDTSSAVKPSTLLTAKKLSLDNSRFGSAAVGNNGVGTVEQKPVGTFAKRVSPSMGNSAGKKPFEKANSVNWSLVNGDNELSKKMALRRATASPEVPLAVAQNGQTTAEAISKYSAHSPPVPPPPPPPIMPIDLSEPKSRQTLSLAKSRTNSVGSPLSTPPPKGLANANGGIADARGDLMASIRNFGGSGGLRKTPTNEEKR